MRVYLDNAATTPMRKGVIEAMRPFLEEYFGNPSSIHAEGRKVRAAIEAARKTVAQCIGSSIGEVFFTSGGTESNNMAIKCAVRDLGVRKIFSSPVEHHCVLHTLDAINRQGLADVEYLPVDHMGRIKLSDLREKLTETKEKTLVSLMHANNEIGTMHDIKAIGDICRELGAYFHSDTVQTVGHFPVSVQEINIDFLSGAGHKFHGPKGAGFIYINGNNSIQPFIDGGSQERNMRGGTENVYAIVGLAKALEIATEGMAEDSNYIRELRDYFKSKLCALFPDIEFNGDPEGESLYTVLSASFAPGPQNEMLLLSLDISGICASGGSACSSGAEAGSHVLQGIGADPERKTIRFSFSALNTREELDFALEKLKTLVPHSSAVASE